MTPWSQVVAALALGGSNLNFAVRPDDQSICNYYASQLFGESNTTTQLRLMQGIVALAYAGGASLQGVSDQATGIFNQGTLDGEGVYLRPWFDGSKATTNLNDQPVGVDWLDGGGVVPLLQFLNGSDDSVDFDKDSNQYRLFTHWFTVFGFVYGCTNAKDFPSTSSKGGQRLSVSYVHKYMDLNQTHVGYFIDQLTVASKYFGFSDTDAQTLDTYMNARYNVRCAPPVEGQLYSICLADECPLAQPNADCEAYKDLGSGIAGNSSGPSSSSSPSSSVATETAASTTTRAAASTTAAASDGSGSDNGGGSGLSAGAIAGIAIGGAVVLLFALGMFMYFRRRGKPTAVPVPVQSTGHLSPCEPSVVLYTPNRYSSVSPTSNPHTSYSGYGVTPGYWDHQQQHKNQPQESPQELGGGEVAPQMAQMAGSSPVYSIDQSRHHPRPWSPPAGFGRASEM